MNQKISGSCRSSFEKLKFEAPLAKIPQQAAGLPEERFQAAVGRPVPCMDGRVLGHQIRFAGGAHLLGEVGVLHIHEVVLVKAAHGLELRRPHRGKAAGAELDLGGLRQVSDRHKVLLVVLLPELE